MCGIFIKNIIAVIFLLCITSIQAKTYYPIFIDDFKTPTIERYDNKISIKTYSDVREYDYMSLKTLPGCNFDNAIINGVEVSKFSPEIGHTTKSYEIISGNSANNIFYELFRNSEERRVLDNEDSLKFLGKSKKGVYRISFNIDQKFEPYELNYFGNFFSSSFKKNGVINKGNNIYEFYLENDSSKFSLFKNVRRKVEKNSTINIEYLGENKQKILNHNANQQLISLRDFYQNKYNNQIDINSKAVNCIEKISLKTTKSLWFDSSIFMSQWSLIPISPVKVEDGIIKIPFLNAKSSIKYKTFNKLTTNDKSLLMKPDYIYLVDSNNLIKNNLKFLLNNIPKKNYRIVSLQSKAHRSALNSIILSGFCNNKNYNSEFENYFEGLYFNTIEMCTSPILIDYRLRVSEGIVSRVGIKMPVFAVILVGDMAMQTQFEFEKNMYSIFKENNIDINDFEIYGKFK